MSQTVHAPTKRLQCNRCGRPASTCICQWITPTANEASVLILQHPLEVTQAKGSARLLQLSLQRCELMVGETLGTTALQEALQAPGPDGRPLTNVLLYPDTPASRPDGQTPPTLPIARPAPAHGLRLVVLDGTWRKSLKMLHANPALASLPRLALSAQTPSRYLIRKAHTPDQLSTLEATCLALSQLEHESERYRPLLNAFDEFIRHLQTFSTQIRQTETPQGI
jgi:DTW domain-containing protein YfiP